MWFHGSFRSRLLGLSKVNQEIGRTILQPPESIESNQFRKEVSTRKWWRHLSNPGNLTRWASCEAQTGNLSSGGFAFDCCVQSDIPWLSWHQSFPFFSIWLIPFHGNWGSSIFFFWQASNLRQCWSPNELSARAHQVQEKLSVAHLQHEIMEECFTGMHPELEQCC